MHFRLHLFLKLHNPELHTTSQEFPHIQTDNIPWYFQDSTVFIFQQRSGIWPSNTLEAMSANFKFHLKKSTMTQVKPRYLAYLVI